MTFAAASALSAPTAAGSEGLFVIAGYGFGHGVGMGQSGAEGFAEHGYSYRQILEHYYPGTRIARVPRTARVRVLLAAGRSAVVVGSAAPIELRDAGGRSVFLPAGRYRLDRTLTIRVDGSFASPTSPLRLDPTFEPLAVGGDRFRGSLLIARDRSGLSVVNDLPIDLYVRGVVAWEMPAGWRFEALEAQAVSARSYALAALGRDRPFDVYPDQRSQMYGGIRAESPSTNGAVAVTSGEVLVWGGRVASTYFSSSSGGRTAAVGDVWSGARQAPYLRSVPDPYDTVSPAHRWGPYLLSAATLSERLGIPDIQDVRLTLNASQRVAAVTIRASDGAHVLSGAALARALMLRSTWFTIRPAGVRGVFPERRSPRHVLPVRRLRHARDAPSQLHVVARRKSRDKAETSSSSMKEALAVAAFLLGVALGVSSRFCGGPMETRKRVLFLACVSSSVAASAIVITALVLHEPLLEPGSPPLALPANEAAPQKKANRAPQRPDTSAPALPALPSRVPIRGVLQWHSPPAGERRSDVAPKAGDENRTPTPAWTRAKPSASEPVPPSPPLTISDVEVVAISPSAARIAWRTSHAAAAQGARGFALAPTVWTEAEGSSVDHETLFSGLDVASTYRIWLQAIDAWGQTTTATLTLSTPAREGQMQAHADGDTILVDGQPFFPRMLWAACSHDVPSKIDEGINLFMGNGCGDDSELLEALGGRALAVVGSASGQTSGDGLMGWYYPDEWDEHLPSKMSVEGLRRLVASPPKGLLSFLTLTNHFFSGAAPLPQGRGIYGSLAQVPDVLGFDIYPMQIWCRDDRFADIFDAQRELDQLTGTKPAFQWIEVRAMQCEGDHLRPGADTVRAETWLAVAGGADGIGYFPNDWTPEVGAEITRTNLQLRELAPALLGESANARSESVSVRVGARSLNGALYVIAVNSSRTPVDAVIQVSGLGARPIEALGESRTITPAGDSFSDHFVPLGVHIYIAAPTTWNRAAWANEQSAAPSVEQAQLEISGSLDENTSAPTGSPFMR